MVVTGRAHCSILLYITLQIHSVEHSYGLGGESLRETFTICIMHRSLLAVWALWWLHNAILQCVTVHRVPKFTSCHNAIMVVTGRAHCSILLYIYIYIYTQLNPGNSKCQGKLKLLRVIGVSSYRGFEQKDHKHLIKVILYLYIYTVCMYVRVCVCMYVCMH